MLLNSIIKFIYLETNLIEENVEFHRSRENN